MKLARFFFSLVLKAKRMKYRLLSDVKITGEKPEIFHPTLISGTGSVEFGNGVKLGYHEAAGYYSGYSLINVRRGSRVFIGDNVHINNNFCIYADISSVTILRGTLIGTNVTIANSDFHSPDPKKRRAAGEYATADIHIGKDVWIGSRTWIGKGVSIGNGSVIAACSLVTNNIPAGEVWGGIPARFIKKI